MSEEVKEEQKISLDDLARQIADRVRPAVPIEYAVWDVQDVAGYLRKSPQVVRERIVCIPDFPRPIRTPSTRGGKISSGHPTWKAIEVIRWNEGHRDMNPGRPRKAS